MQSSRSSLSKSESSRSSRSSIIKSLFISSHCIILSEATWLVGAAAGARVFTVILPGLNGPTCTLTGWLGATVAFPFIYYSIMGFFRIELALAWPTPIFKLILGTLISRSLVWLVGIYRFLCIGSLFWRLIEFSFLFWLWVCLNKLIWTLTFTSLFGRDGGMLKFVQLLPDTVLAWLVY